MGRYLLTLVLLVGCGSSGGSGGDGNPGGDGTGGGGGDAPANVPATIMITGVTSSIGISGRTPQGNITVTAFRAADDSMVATTTSSNTAGATKGTFSLTITTNGMPLDGYLTATMGATYLTTYLYPPAPLSADFAGATVLLLTQSTFDTAQTLLQLNQTPGMAFVGAEVTDATGATVGGAVVTSSPAGTIKYNSGGLPSKNATSTATDGVAYDFNVAPGTVSVSATKTGSTFHTHSIKARPDVITLTLIAP